MSLPIRTFLGQAVHFKDHFELTRLVGLLGVGFLNDGMGVGSKIHWLHTKVKDIPIPIQILVMFGHFSNHLDIGLELLFVCYT